MTYSEPLPARAVCKACGWKGLWREILKAPHPWDADDILVGCPTCQDVNVVYEACGVEGCDGRFYVTHFPKGPGSGITLCETHEQTYEDPT